MLSNGKCPVTSLSLKDTVNKDQITTNDALILSSGENNKLKWIFVERKLSGNGHIACLAKAINAISFICLEGLQLSQSFPDDADVNGRLLTDLLPSIASHCPNLSDLDLSENNLGVPGACAVGEAFVKLATNRKKLELNLIETNIDNEAAATVFSEKVLASLEDVSNPLSCEIDLCVDNNPLGHSGLLAIFRMFRNRKCLINETKPGRN